MPFSKTLHGKTGDICGYIVTPFVHGIEDFELDHKNTPAVGLKLSFINTQEAI
jgi:hypothetical protein